MISSRSLRASRSQRGFTLIELVIVLGVATVLMAGLWRLMSGGGQQMRDQAVANQHQQLITSVKSFLSSPNGQNWLNDSAHSSPTGVTSQLVLPTVGADGVSNTNCKNSITDTNGKFLCDFLPIGFINTSANAYGQTYVIYVNTPAKAATEVVSSYSFMIYTQNGSVIPDTSGGRISSLIGGDGGFVYANNVCNAAVTSWACGAYGAWSQLLSSYAITGASGHVASLSSIAGGQDLSTLWLARRSINGDIGYNTMSANLFMLNTATTKNDIYMMASTTATGAGGNIYLQGGCVSGAASTCDMSTPNIDSGSIITNINEIKIGHSNMANVALLIATATGYEAIHANGDAYVKGTLTAGYFVYQSDENLKKNIQPLENSLEKIEKLKAVSFVFKEGDQRQRFGLLAQDVEKVYPELVSQGKDGYKNVEYTGMIAPLVAAVQELEKKNAFLQQRLDDQEKILQKLQKKH